MLSLSQSVHAEVFLRRRSARDAFFISPVDRFCFLLELCILCLQSFTVLLFFSCVPAIYLFVRATNCCCWRGHTHLLYVDLVFLVTHKQPVVMLGDGDLREKKKED